MWSRRVFSTQIGAGDYVESENYVESFCIQYTDRCRVILYSVHTATYRGLCGAILPFSTYSIHSPYTKTFPTFMD